MKVNFDEVLDVVKNNNGKVIILNGTMVVGKSTTARKLGEFLSYDLNVPILYFTNGLFKEVFEDKLIKKSNNFIIDDTSGLDNNYLKNKILEVKKERKVKYVIIDDIWLVSYKSDKCLSHDVQHQKLIEELVKITKEVNITIFITRLIHISPRNTDYYNIEILE